MRKNTIFNLLATTAILAFSPTLSIANTSTIELGGIPDISTVADIIKVTNNSGTYEISMNGTTIPDSGGQYNLYGTDIYLKIEGSNVVVYSPLLNGTGNPATYPLPANGQETDLTFMKERVEQADGVTINADGYVLLLANSSLNNHNGEIWSSTSFNNKGIIVGYTDASSVTFMTENGNFDNSGKIYISTSNGSGEINVNAGNFTNSGEINSLSYTNIYVDNGSLANTGTISSIGDAASLSIYTNQGTLQNDGTIKLDTVSGYLQMSSQVGDIVNTGTIDANFTNSTSANLYASEGNFVNNGTIKMNGQEHIFASLGSQGDNKFFTNNGIIEVNSQGGHLSLNSYNFLNTNEIDISYNATTQTSGGLYIYAQNDFVNKGNISGISKSDDGTGSSGMSINGGNIDNQGSIIFDGSQIENGNASIYTGNGNFKNSGTIDLKVVDYSNIQVYSQPSDPADFINTGTISIQNNKNQISIHNYYGNFYNYGKLILNVLNQDSGQNGLSEIGTYENVVSPKTVNRGLMDVQGYNNFAITDNYLANRTIDNYGQIYLSKDGEFGYTKNGTFYQLSDYLRILSSEGVRRDYNYNTAAASVIDLQSEGITDFYNIGTGKVYKEESAANTMPTNGIAGTRVQYNGKYYWEVETGVGSALDFMGDLTQLSSESALYLESGNTYDITSGTILASIYSLTDTTASPKPSVDNTLVLNKSTSGTLTMTGHNDWYNGVFNLSAGSLHAIGDESLFGGTINVTNNSEIFISGDQNVQNLSLSSARVTFDHLNPYKTLTVNNLTSTNANIITMYSDLGNDSSRSDKIVLTGTVTGSTFLNIIGTPYGNGGDNVNGIMVVDASATTTQADSFQILGGQVDSGSTVYKLYRGNSTDANSFFLSNTGIMTDTFKTMVNMPAVHVNIVKTGMNELRKRMGELRDNSPEHKHGAWVRSYAKNMEVDELLYSKMNIYGLEAGYDKQIMSDCDKKVYVGIMAGYLNTDNIRTKQQNGVSGSGNANTPTVGLYATWLDRNGWFVDGTLRSFWSDMNAKSYTSGGTPVSYDATRQFNIASLEFGKQFRFNESEKGYVTLEPKFEAMYGYAKSKSFKTNLGNKVHFGETKTLTNRASMKVGYSQELNNGSIIEPFVEVALIREWDGKTDISYTGTKYNSDISGTSGEISFGLNSKVNNNWNLYSDFAFEKGDVIKAFSGNVGVRYNF